VQAVRAVRTVRSLWLAGAVLAMLAAAAPAHAATGAPVVVGMRLSGVVDPFEAGYIKSGIAAAQDEGAAAVLLTIDTPGGLDSSMRQITQAILNSPVPVICYVSPEGARAASAGTFIMYSCSVAAMAPATNIGAAHPVGVAGAIEQSKVTNDAVAYIESLARARHRNVSWAADAVRNSVSISADDALSMRVIDVISPDQTSLLTTLDGRTAPVNVGRTVVLHTAGATIQSRSLGLGFSILHGLFTPDLAFLFFYLGIGLIILELIHPGILAGVLGALFLVGSFVSFGELPFQLIGAVLLIASAVFFLLELKHPGVGVWTLAGTVTLVLGGLFLFNPHVPNARVSPWLIVIVAGGAVLFFGFALSALWRVRHLPPGMTTRNLIGMEGVVTTALAPVGVVQVASERWTAESTAGAMPAGARVRVVGTEGLRLRVAPIDALPATPTMASQEGGTT
jgi:membrane-bound serine protease (ClpP class)